MIQSKVATVSLFGVARVEVHIHVDDIADFIEWEEGWDLEAKALFDLRNHVGFGPISYFIEWEDS